MAARIKPEAGGCGKVLALKTPVLSRLRGRGVAGGRGGEQLQDFLLVLIPLAQGAREQRGGEVFEMVEVERVVEEFFQERVEVGLGVVGPAFEGAGLGVQRLCGGEPRLPVVFEFGDLHVALVHFSGDAVD